MVKKTKRKAGAKRRPGRASVDGAIDSLLARLRGLEDLVAGPKGMAAGEGLLAQLKDALAGADATRRDAAILRLDRIAENQAPRLKRYLQSFAGIGLESDAHLARILDEARGEPLEVRNFLAFQIQAVLFARGRPAHPDLELARHLFHRHFVRDLAGHVGRVPHIPVEERDGRSVVFVTQQLLGPRHAPTRDVLSYCQYFRHRLGMRVRLICADQFPVRVPVPFHRSQVAHPSGRPSGRSTVTTDGPDLDLWSLGRPFPDKEAVVAALAHMAEARPALVIAHGAANPLADLCRGFSTVVTRNTTAEIGPFESDLSLLVRDPTQAETDLLAALDRTPDIVLRTHPAFDLPQPAAPWGREALDMPPEAVVAGLVGNRLAREVTPAFLDMLEAVAAAHPAFRLVVVGTVADEAAFLGRRPALTRAVRFLGFREDLLDLSAAFDLFLNPPRQGGGTSAAYALVNGVPVVTPSGQNDVAKICGPDFEVDGLEAMAARLAALITDADRRRYLSEAARTRASEIGDVSIMWLEPLREIAARTGAPLTLPGTPLAA